MTCSRYRKCFENPASISCGQWVHKELVPKVFKDVITSKPGRHCDARIEGLKKARCEIKSFRAVFSDTAAQDSFFKNDDFYTRAMFAHDSHQKGRDRKGNIRTINSCKFQQVKPKEYDWLLGVGIFLDKIRFYLIPSKDVNSKTGKAANGKMKLHAQHRNSEEGQIHIKEDFGKYLILEMDTPLSKVKKLDYKLADFIK